MAVTGRGGAFVPQPISIHKFVTDEQEYLVLRFIRRLDARRTFQQESIQGEHTLLTLDEAKTITSDVDISSAFRRFGILAGEGMLLRAPELEEQGKVACLTHDGLIELRDPTIMPATEFSSAVIILRKTQGSGVKPKQVAGVLRVTEEVETLAIHALDELARFGDVGEANLIETARLIRMVRTAYLDGKREEQ
jgi:hypothetical protein